MSRPRTPSFGAKQRSRLARRAATARWARLGRGVLTLDQIRDAVVKALAERESKLAPGGAGIPPGLPLLPAPPAPVGSEAKSPVGREAEAPGKRNRKPRAYLFDSYGRGDASARDEIYILIVLEKMPEDWAAATTDLTSDIGDALGDDYSTKEIVLYLSDAATYRKWKGAYGTPHHAVATEGIRIV
jgi:hypothetical protein